MADTMPTLWVTGAPGIGKSTVGWGLFEAVASRGGSVAYLDIDQLGLLGPPPGGGDRSHRITTDNLVPLLHGLRRAGVRQTIVSGVVDPERGIDHHLRAGPPLDGVPLDLVRLSCRDDVLRGRFLGRGSSPELLDELQRYARLLDRTGIGEPVDTTDHTPAQTVAGLLGRCLIAAPGAGEVPTGPPPSIPVAGVIGPTAVGKSTAGWHALRTLWQEGRPAAFVDAQQLGFVHPRPSDAFVRAQISILLHGYQRAGATVALLVSRDPVLARPPFGEGAGTLIRLAADPDALARRVESRARGSSALLAGDELRGAPAPTRRAVLDRALREAENLARACPDLPVVDSSRQAAEATAAALLEHLRSSVLALRSLPPRPGTVRLVLNRDRILETAIAQGLDRFSMAGVSRELGVTDMALYRYVGSREELYSLAAARAHATFQFRLEGTDWRAHLVEVAEQTWQLAARHPGIERYLLDGPYHPETLRVFDASIAGFRALAPQFSADQAYVLLSRVVSFTLAAADNALSRRWQPDPGEPSALFRWTVEALVDGMVGRLDDLPTDPSARGLGPESAISPSRS